MPVIELSGLSEAEKRAYILADNKLALNAGWAEDLLAAEVADLDALGFDLSLAGFADAEVGRLVDLFQQGTASSFPDEAPAPPEVPVTQPGKPRSNDLHPTMKPVALVERAIRNSSNSPGYGA